MVHVPGMVTFPCHRGWLKLRRHCGLTFLCFTGMLRSFLGLDGVDGRDCDSYFWHYFVQLLMLHLDLGFVVVLNPVWLVLASLKTSSNAILMYNAVIGLFSIVMPLSCLKPWDGERMLRCCTVSNCSICLVMVYSVTWIGGLLPRDCQRLWHQYAIT